MLCGSAFFWNIRGMWSDKRLPGKVVVRQVGVSHDYMSHDLIMVQIAYMYISIQQSHDELLILLYMHSL